MLWLWTLRDVAIIGVGFLFSVLALVQSGTMLPMVATVLYAFLSIRVESASILDFLKEQKEKYVVMADTNLAVNFDFNALIQAHMDSQADVTVAYREEPLPGDLTGHRDIGKSLYYTLAIDNGRVTKMYMNSKEPGVQNFSMNIYIIDRELLIDQINTAGIPLRRICGANQQHEELF